MCDDWGLLKVVVDKNGMFKSLTTAVIVVVEAIH